MSDEKKTSYEQVKDDAKGVMDKGCMVILVIVAILFVLILIGQFI